MQIRGIALIALVLLIAGCNTRYKVETKSTAELTIRLKGLSPDVQTVVFTFSRLDVFCDITMKKEPAEVELNSIISEIKSFVTPEHMRAIADKVKWKLEISEFHLNIDTDPNNKLIEHRYAAKYFKSFDASDHSEPNIDGYKSWYEESRGD